MHPTLQTTVTLELAERLSSKGGDRQRAEEEGEGNVDDGSDNEHVNGYVWGLRQADTRMGDGGDCSVTGTTTTTSTRADCIPPHGPR